MNAEQLTALLTELRRKPDATGVPRKVGKLLRSWPVVVGSLEPETAAWWDLQHSIAVLAPAIAPHHWRAAWRLTALMSDPLWRAKVRSICHFARFDAAFVSVMEAPEQAIAIARQMPRQFRAEKLIAIAVAIFPTHRRLAMDLYRAIGSEPYLSTTFVLGILPHDWRTALAEFRARDLAESEHLLKSIVERAVADDFALAESLAHELRTPVYRMGAVATLVSQMPLMDAPACLALMARPLYRDARIPLFVRFDGIFRAWCDVPPRATDPEIPIERPEGESPFWEKLRAILHRTEEDLPWALGQIRDEAAPAHRRLLYRYAAAEYCHLR